MPQSDDPVQHGSSDGSLDGIKSEGWTASVRKGGRDQIGIVDGFTSEYMDGLHRNPQSAFCAPLESGHECVAIVESLDETNDLPWNAVVALNQNAMSMM